jgi:protein SCO1/2
VTIDLSGGMAALKPKQAVLKPGETVPDFAMTTQDGKPLHLSDLRGNVVVLTFIYTRCPLPDFCPLIDRKFKALADKLALVPARAEHARLLSVSFDPEHDTPETLRKHARLKGAEPPLWSFAVASHDELQKVAPSLGLSYLPGENEIAHSLSTAIIDAEGKLVRLETGRSWDPTDFFKTIYPLLPVSRP